MKKEFNHETNKVSEMDGTKQNTKLH